MTKTSLGKLNLIVFCLTVLLFGCTSDKASNTEQEKPIVSKNEKELNPNLNRFLVVEDKSKSLLKSVKFFRDKKYKFEELVLPDSIEARDLILSNLNSDRFAVRVKILLNSKIEYKNLIVPSNTFVTGYLSKRKSTYSFSLLSLRLDSKSIKFEKFECKDIPKYQGLNVSEITRNGVEFLMVESCILGKPLRDGNLVFPEGSWVTFNRSLDENDGHEVQSIIIYEKIEVNESEHPSYTQFCKLKDKYIVQESCP